MKFPIACLGLLLLLTSCSDPVAPEYQFEEGFYIVEGNVLDQSNRSQVIVRQSVLQFGNYVLSPVDNAVVVLVDGDGNEDRWTNVGGGIYLPFTDFEGENGQTYFIRVETPDGTLIESAPERIPDKVGVENLRFDFDQEAYFSESLDRFVPAFTFFGDVADPAGTANFYQYRLFTAQMIDICITCREGVYRNGDCQSRGPQAPTYDYLCETECWNYRLASGLELQSDRFNPGGVLEGVRLGRIDFNGSGGLLVIVEQLNVSADAFAYGEVQKSLVSGTGGLNATLPSPLYGNVQNTDADGLPVLGYFGAASVTLEELYFDRDEIDGVPLSMAQAPRIDPVLPAPPQAPCAGGGRTPVEPEGWGG